MIVTDPTQAAARVAGTESLVDRRYLLAFSLVVSLFFLWAFANNFNDILIKHFQKALDLSRAESGLVQTAFYFGYFTCALPAGWFMKRYGYKAGVLAGLGLYALGALLFVPAASIRTFGFFLFALYVIAAGLAFLETAANPYVTVMGSPTGAARRINFAQSFNGLGATVAPFLGGVFILSGKDLSPQELAAMSPAALEAYRVAEAQAVQTPYAVLALCVLTVALLIWKTRFPTIEFQSVESRQGIAGSPLRLPQVHWAILAQAFYVGIQVSIWSFFINFAHDVAGVDEKSAATFLSLSIATFMIGRFAGTWLMRTIAPHRLLTIFAIISAGLMVLAMQLDGFAALVAFGASSAFMSIMFPTIFALGIANLGEATNSASSYLIMAIVGGALMPPVMGQIADAAGSIQISLALPLAGFLMIAAFGLVYERIKVR